MKRKGFFSNWKNIKSVSFGLVYVFFMLWLIFNTSQFIPADRVNDLYRVLIGYGLLNAVIFGIEDIRNKLFNVKFIKFLPRLFLFTLGGIIVFYFLLARFELESGGLFDLISNVPIWLMFIHGLIFATTETAIWQGYLDEKIGQPWSAIVAGLFHWGVWTGSAFFVIITASLLFMMFSLVNWYFRKDKDDLAPALGVHFAYNLIKLGLIVSAGVML
jgi:hypothetical protein